MKKKIFSIFLVMVLCIGMTAGCKKNVGTSQDNAITEEDDDSKEEAKSYRFGFSCITMENPYYITLEQALREAIEAQGSTLVTKDPALNVDTQIEQIHQIRLGYELLDVFVPFSARFVRHLHLDVLKIGHACFQFFRCINARMDVRDKAVNATQL